MLDMPPKPCDRPVCYGRSHLLGPYEVGPTILTWGGPCSLGTMMLRKWPIFDQFGPPWPESRLLRAKTGDSGLENIMIHIPTLDRLGKMD